MTTTRTTTHPVVAKNRAEHEPCQKGTDACCVDHDAEPAEGYHNEGCETW